MPKEKNDLQINNSFQLPWSNAIRSPDDQIYIQNQLLAKKGPPIPDDLKNQTEAYRFIELCLQVNLEQRPSARDLLNHPYSRVSTGKILLIIVLSLHRFLILDN